MMKIILFPSLFVLFSCSSAPKPFAEEKENRHPLNVSTIEEVSERVQKVIEPQIGEGKNVGAIIGIYYQGKSKFLSFGETKKGNKTPPNENTVFEIGSITKTFTGLLLAQEIESKRVKDNDKLSSFQKKWIGQKAGDITLLELVTHRSGLPRLPCNLDHSDPEQPYALYTEENLIELFKDRYQREHQDCVFENHPTGKINYSNLGFATLGYVLGLKEKTTYMDLLKKKILKPLNMEDTTHDLSRDQLRRLAQGYDSKGNPAPLWKRQLMMGNGALRSTAAEMFLYAQAYLHPDTTPISAAIRQTIQPQFEESPKRRIGYAWFLSPSGNFWHDGGTGGYSSYLKVNPDKDFAIFYLSNTAKELNCVNEAVSDLPCPLGIR